MTFNQVLPEREFASTTCGYFRQYGLLAQIMDSTFYDGDEILQVLVPSKLRQIVLQSAPDGIAGHLGVK